MTNDNRKSPETVEKVDLERYAGLWYQVARYPHFFQKGECALSTARYTLLEKGKILVENHCWKDEVGGEINQKVRAKAWPADESGSKLKVRFYGLFVADYYIIELDTDAYQWAVVTTPDMNTLWVLSRGPALEEKTFQNLLGRLDRSGFDISKIIRTSKQ
jgi:apolipoprotein D and lipocalin family protein